MAAPALIAEAEPRFRPFWFDQALRQENPLPTPPLRGAISADVCIVGGGFTGLWTAIQLKLAKPGLDVVIVEKDLCGAGASGRNGGCLLGWSTRLFTLQRLYGQREATRLVRESEQAIYAIEQFCRAHQIDADLRIDGTLYTATNQAQMGSMDALMAGLTASGCNSWQRWATSDIRGRAGSVRHLEGWYSPAAGSVQPGLLVRGLARVARALGVQIFEGSPMRNLRQSARPVVQTELGEVACGQVVLAMNAWMATQFSQFARSIAVVSSDMIVTEARPGLLARTGLAHGTSVLDSRTFVYYYRSTSDGRIMLGKGGNTFAWRGRILPQFDQPSAYADQLKDALHEFFPAWRDVPLAASWNGPSDRSVTGLPFFGRLDKHPNIFYGFGYSGNGVAPSYMGGLILSSLVLGLDNDWTRSGLVRGPLGMFPPEPVRWVAAMVVRDAIRRKEYAEDIGHAPSRLDTWLAKLANAAGKADKPAR